MTRSRSPAPALFTACAALLVGCAASPHASTPTEAAAMNPRSAADIAATLDALHDAASKADGPRYFALFSPTGVFIGTDASERWTLEQFRAYADPHFSRGTGWTYTPFDRHIDVSADGSFAWFDELLRNQKYGTCRGTGVLRKDAASGRWLLEQYHLTIPIPNDLAKETAERIRVFESGAGGAPPRE